MIIEQVCSVMKERESVEYCLQASENLKLNPPGGGGGEELSYKNDGGCWSEILKRSPWRYQEPALRLDFFLTLRCTNSKTTRYLLKFFFLLNTLKGTAKAPAVDLEAKLLRRNQNSFFFTP